jgi:hypothetical protein
LLSREAAGAVGRVCRRRRRPYRALGSTRSAWPACHHPRRHRHDRRQRIKLYKPIDEADRIDDWLYLPETLYALMLIIVVSAGAGPYSFDALILGLINKYAAQHGFFYFLPIATARR